MQQSAPIQKQFPASASSPSGDECGQLITNLALALLACHLQKPEMRRSYTGQAHSNVVQLSSQGFTIRSAGPTKLVRVISEGFGLRETLLLPILGHALLLPPVDMQEVARAMRIFCRIALFLHLQTSALPIIGFDSAPTG